MLKVPFLLRFIINLLLIVILVNYLNFNSITININNFFHSLVEAIQGDVINPPLIY